MVSFLWPFETNTTVPHIILFVFTFQVTFAPTTAGSFEAIIAVYAHLVVSSPQDTNKPIANVILKCKAEEPRLEVQTSSLSDLRAGGDGRQAHSAPVLDYGIMVGGNTVKLQLKLANRGSASLPLCLSITGKVCTITHVHVHTYTLCVAVTGRNSVFN